MKPEYRIECSDRNLRHVSIPTDPVMDVIVDALEREIFGRRLMNPFR